MTTVAFLVHYGREPAQQMAHDALAWLQSRGDQGRVLLLTSADRVQDQGTDRPLEEVDLSKVDLAVSLGGDGTFLRLVSVACPQGVPLLGVNFGRLGYLLDTPRDRLLEAISHFVNGSAEIEARALLDLTVAGRIEPPGAGSLGERGERALPTTAVARRSFSVLNEVVLEKTVPGHTVALSTAVDGAHLATYRADGVLVATPTGSTAYNLSAGGPVLAPNLPAMVLTPVAPHLSSGSSVVLGAERSVTVRVGEGRPAVLVVDGLPVGYLAPEASVTCRLATEPARLVRFTKRPLATEIGTVLAPPLRANQAPDPPTWHPPSAAPDS